MSKLQRSPNSFSALIKKIAESNKQNYADFTKHRNYTDAQIIAHIKRNPNSYYDYEDIIKNISYEFQSILFAIMIKDSK